MESSATGANISVETVENTAGAVPELGRVAGTWGERDAGFVVPPLVEPRPLRWSAMGQTGCQNIPSVREGMAMSLVFFNKHSFLVY